MDHSKEDFEPIFTEVNRYNIKKIYEELPKLLEEADFISIDTEFTGLGDRRKIHSKNIEQRYGFLADLVRQYSLLSFGLCIFKKMQNQDRDCYHFTGFNFLTYCENEFTVDPEALRFMNSNGFSLDRLLDTGCSYLPGTYDTKKIYECEDIDTNILLRRVFHSIVLSEKPLVIHNGLIDLVFLYWSFYADLPSSLETFILDMFDMFPGGVFDTKYIAEYEIRMNASYLIYLYHAYLRKENLNEKRTIYRNNSTKEIYCDPFETKLPAKQRNDRCRELNTGKPYCENYALYGWCGNDKGKCRPHDINFILDCEEGINTPFVKEDTSHEIPSDPQRTHALHSACYDAYMTGYIFNCQKDGNPICKYKNKLYLTGKSMPLVIRSSSFSSKSAEHQKIMSYLQSAK